MITIISQNSDHSTNIVIDWLKYFKGSFMRINGVDAILNYSYLSEVDNIVDFGGDSCVVWFRRWIENNFFYETSDIFNNQSLNRQIVDYKKKEATEIKDYFLEKLKVKNILSDFNYIPVNKLRVLEIAQEIGLLIPQSIITSNKKTLETFFRKEKRVIIKNIANPTFLEFKDNFYAGYTTLMSNELFEKIPEHFFPSLVQVYIDKEIELRSFYLDGAFYTMAIFSQQNEKTIIDFREYDYQNPNRNIPFTLPSSIENLLNLLMQKLGLNCGSIDLILTPDNDIYFLEINPIGQFGMVSVPCNYYLEEKIAQWLIKHDL